MEELDKLIADMTAAIAKNDNAGIQVAAVPLLFGLVKDARRIAIALEKIATFELHRVGDVAIAKATEK